MRRTVVCVAAAGAMVLAGCTGQSQQSTTPASTASPAALKNPTEFPMAPDSKIIDVKPFSQTVTAAQSGGSSLSAQGAGTYSGFEVLAASPMSPASLRKWLADLGHRPPEGYVLENGSATASGRVTQTLDVYGISYAAFRSANKAINRGVVVVAMDPKLVKEKLGIALDLVERYRSLPAALRDPIDREFKSKTGFTVTEATDPSSPLGMTLSALHDLQSNDERAVIMVDATKK